MKSFQTAETLKVKRQKHTRSRVRAHTRANTKTIIAGLSRKKAEERKLQINKLRK